MGRFGEAAAAQAATESIVVSALAKVPGRIAHIDGDYLAYYHSGNDDTEPGMARANALAFIQKALDRTGAEKAVIHVTAANCHKGERYLVATVKPYQAQRAGGRKPKNWAYMREWVENSPMSKVWASREADDGFAACAAYAVRQGRLDAIVTADKDMRMLPGVHLNWKDHSILTEVKPDAWAVWGADGKLYGDRWFWLQMLMGDTADNIPGLEYAFTRVVKSDIERMVKVGEKTAIALLGDASNSKEAYEVVSDCYRRSYRGVGNTGDDRFVEQAALLWLRQDNKAEVTNFAQKWGAYFDDDMWAATDRLAKRVADARAALHGLGT